MSRGMKSETLAGYLNALRRQAVCERMVPEAVADHAVASTLRAMGRTGESSASQRRVRAYFWTVVRREVMRAPEAVEARAHFLLAAVVADLQECGRSPQGVWDELQRGWAHRVPASVLGQFQQRLCA